MDAVKGDGSGIDTDARDDELCTCDELDGGETFTLTLGGDGVGGAGLGGLLIGGRL